MKYKVTVNIAGRDYTLVAAEDESHVRRCAAHVDAQLREVSGSRISQADAEYWAPFLEEQIGKGNNSRDGLKAACAHKGMGEELLHQVFYGWGGLIREMVCRGRIVCGTGTQKAYFLPKSVKWMDRDQARRVFLRRYFERYGPATLSDCRYFFGNWKKGDMDPLLQELLPELCCTVIDGKKYYSLREPISDGQIPACVLVPGFDQLIL